MCGGLGKWGKGSVGVVKRIGIVGVRKQREREREREGGERKREREREG